MLVLPLGETPLEVVSVMLVGWLQGTQPMGWLVPVYASVVFTWLEFTETELVRPADATLLGIEYGAVLPVGMYGIGVPV